MNSNFKIVIAFVSGLSIGAFAMKKYMDYKDDQAYYEEDEDENIEEYDVTNDLEQAFSKPNNEPILDASTRESRVNYSKIKSVNDAEYKRLLDDLRYSVDEQAKEAAIIEEESNYVEEEIDKSKPYYIPESAYQEIDEYESDEYTYYADGYLTDSYGLPVTDEDIDNTLGLGFETYFDKYDTDQIWIRNDQREMDFSIIRDLDRFEDVASPRIKRMVGL